MEKSHLFESRRFRLGICRKIGQDGVVGTFLLRMVSDEAAAELGQDAQEGAPRQEAEPWWRPTVF